MIRAAATLHQALPSVGHPALEARLTSIPGVIAGIMGSQQANGFVESWVRAWNDHDVDAVLGHFTDDAVFSSPVAAQLLDDSDGVQRGKAAIRSYWRGGIERIPDLHFEVVGVYVGVPRWSSTTATRRAGWSTRS